VSPGEKNRSPLAVTYAWRETPHPVAPAARLWVAPNGQVVDADVWPRVVRTMHVAAVPIATAWRRVAQGKAPIAVPNSGFLSPTGTGVARSVQVVQVRVAARHGKIYLVPAYRFSGTVHLGGAGTHTWYALVPAAAR
jgi:hypothetical protein